jgi:membrane protease YdiL (CAAX protease family)
LATHLREQATRDLALDAAGKSPWQWQFRESEDIVAGRVFGAREFAFDDNGLRVRSDGTPFEVGLPLARPLDLQRFPIFHITASADAPGTLRIVTRTTLDAPQSASSSNPLHDRETTLDLRSDNALPDRAAMLRLQFDLPAGKTLHLAAVSLELPTHSSPAPIRELPAGPVEQQLLALRRIHDEQPAAIVVPAEGTRVLAHAHAQDTSWAPNVFGAVVFALVSLFVRVRPPHNARVRALVEIALVLTVPLWLIVGGHFSGRVDRMQALLIATSTIYSISLGWPRTWLWIGGVRAWMLAAAIVALAICIGFALHRSGEPLRAMDSGHVIRYLGWALIQQYLICAIVLPRWQMLTGSTLVAIYLSALCFALLHTPNSTLMLATFAGGLCWCALYLRERALFPLAFSHAASALLLIALLPPDILLSAEVSARFFQ